MVVLGAKSRCQKKLNGSGSLWLKPSINGADQNQPFHIGNIKPGKGFVHVFDDVTLGIILKELDTITDFLRYLCWKEKFIHSDKLALAEGEENMLGAYLSDLNEKNQHDIVLPPGYDKLVVQKDNWMSVRQSPEFFRKKEADKISYSWDDLINEFCGHIFDGTILGNPDYTTDDHEIILRVLAQESRFQRRMLAEALRKALQKSKTEPENIFLRTTVSKENPDTAYVFGFFPGHKNDYERYRLSRRKYLSDYCQVVAYKRRELRMIVGIAMEKDQSNKSSKDIVLFESPEDWSKEMTTETEKIQNTRNIQNQKNLKWSHVQGNEYPEPRIKPQHINRKIGRNERCPCGSDIKYKKCCGRPR